MVRKAKSTSTCRASTSKKRASVRTKAVIRKISKDVKEKSPKRKSCASSSSQDNGWGIFDPATRKKKTKGKHANNMFLDWWN